MGLREEPTLVLDRIAQLEAASRRGARFVKPVDVLQLVKHGPADALRIGGASRGRGSCDDGMRGSLRSSPAAWPSPPPAQGLYDPKREHDACGVGFVADLKGRPSRKIIEHGLQILENLTHRGAAGADPLAGDGAGIWCRSRMISARGCAPLGIKLPEPGHYAVGHMFMPRNRAQRIYCESVVERVVEAEGLKLLGWRDVPSDNSCLSASVIETEPAHRQVFIGRGPGIEDENEFERRLYILRKVISNTINGETGGRDIGFYTVSLSCRTLVYKGMFLAYQLGAYYPDLHHPLLRLGARARASALLDQHLPLVEARPSLPHGRP